MKTLINAKSAMMLALCLTGLLAVPAYAGQQSLKFNKEEVLIKTACVDGLLFVVAISRASYSLNAPSIIQVYTPGVAGLPPQPKQCDS